MATQDQGLAHLLEQSALYKHIQVYHWLADSWNWTEMAKLFTQDTEFEFEVVSTADSQAGGIQLQNQVVKGQEAVTAMFDALVKPYKKAQHVIVNTNFDIDGTAATGTANILFWGVPDLAKPHLYYSIGSRYHWKFRKEGSPSPAGSTWKTAHTKVEKIWENSTIGA